MLRALHDVRLDDRLAGLVHEQIDGVGRVVPEEVVGPGARFAPRIRVGAAEEVGLDVHLLDRELTGRDPLVDELVARVEAADVARHRDAAAAGLGVDDRLRAGEAVGERDLDEHVLAGVEAGHGLIRVHLRRRGEDHGVDLVERQRLVEISERSGDPVLGGERGADLGSAVDDGHHLGVVDRSERVEMLGTECAATGECELHGSP